MQIALYKAMAGNYTVLREVEDWLEEADDYVRLTSIEDVTFVELPAEETVEKQVSYLDEMVKQAKAECQEKLNYIEQRKQELLALPGVEK